MDQTVKTILLKSLNSSPQNNVFAAGEY